MRSAALVVALVACLHAGAWALRQTQAPAPDASFDGILNSVSYSPFTTSAHPDDEGSAPPEERIRAELKAIAPYTKAIRLYSSTGGVEQVPKIADEFDLKVWLGIWLDKAGRRPQPEFEAKCDNSRFEQEMSRLLDSACSSRNVREVRSALDLLKKNRNVTALMVGNETLFRRDLTADKLADIVKGVKLEVAKLSLSRAVPVSTGEIYSELLGAADGEQLRPDNELNVFQRLGAFSLGVYHQVAGGAAERPATPTERALAAERLVSTLDFVAVHVLPYWGGIPAGSAVSKTVDIYNELKNKFKGKRVVIAEFGWPSSGYNRNAAVPGRFEQAEIMRGFVASAKALGIDYNLIEAYDQPWKTIEGSVGAYWGLFDNQTHEPKFAWSGPVTDADGWKIAAMAVAIGLLISLPVLGMASVTLAQAVFLVVASHVVGAWAATVFDYWVSHYFVAGAAFALGLGTVLLVPLVVIALGRIGDIAGILFGRAPARLLRPKDRAGVDAGYAPKVSIHIPAYREPPEMLKATLDALSRLDYPNFECVLVINNTPDPAMTDPVEEHCRTLGDRFKFLNVQKLEGFKAGALRVALAHTAPDAEIIGIIDADYAVTPDWLADLVPAFADPKVGLVQAPQDHRDGDRSPLHQVMNGEYAGFFDIGMVERNEVNAIIVHGTMCLIRRAALDEAGGWSSDTICEDTDLGLSIIERGWLAQYTNRRYGYGLLPDTFEAFKKQRDRWAAGGFQIVKKHWRRFLPGASLLTRDQKREFALGWLNWMGAETVGVLVAILNLIWVPVVAFLGIAVPDKILTLPIMATFAISVIHFAALYRRRVAIPPSEAAGAMVAAMAMQWTVARAVANGVLPDMRALVAAIIAFLRAGAWTLRPKHLTFVRTAKGGACRKKRAFPAFAEAVLGGLLVLGACIVIGTNYDRVREINLFGCVLVVQSLPFLAAAAIAAFERSRLNDYAVLHSLKARLVDALAPVVPMIRRNPLGQEPGSATPE
jgi:cellulose synthase/poly-beta-1,6-N-acetylglucosamine synthase-like glycosyltransferase/exo-beta-1,3-glucanase (GH17 family)